MPYAVKVTRTSILCSAPPSSGHRRLDLRLHVERVEEPRCCPLIFAPVHLGSYVLLAAITRSNAASISWVAGHPCASLAT